MRKRLISVLLASAMALALAACGQSGSSTGTDDGADTSTDEGTGTDASGGSNILVAYFSWSGNTEEMATYIQEQTGGDLYEIQPVIPYPEDYNECGDVALEERDNNARPEIQDLPADLFGYDTLFIGYPNWNADLPMPLYTFLEEYDLSGKTIIPFTTHGGSGFSRTIDTIAELEPDAQVEEDGLAISRNAVPDAEGEVTDWVSGLGI